MIYNLLRKNSLLLVHIPFLMYVLILTILLLMPSQKLPEMLEVSDKIKHFIAFAIFTFMFSLSFHFYTKKSSEIFKLLKIVIIVAIIYGGLTEFLQTYVPGRSGDLFDFSLNVLGSIAGLIAFWQFIKFSKIIYIDLGTKK